MIIYEFTDVVIAAFILAFLYAQVLALRQHHSQEIYAIWYVFSLFGLIFLALHVAAEREGKEVTDILGPSWSTTLKVVYRSLTEFTDELLLVGAFVYLAIGPQLLTYFLAGLSGSA